MKNENRYRVIKNSYGYYESEVRLTWFPIWIPFITSWSDSESQAWDLVKQKVKGKKSQGKKESEL